MKRIALFIAALMILSFGLANAQDAITVSVTASALWDDAGTPTLKPAAFTYELTLNVVTAPLAGSSNGFEIYVQDGAGAFGVPAGAWSNVGPAAGFYDGLNRFVNTFSLDGANTDTVGFGGYTGGSNYIPVGTHTALWTIATSATAAIGEVLCIDTAFYPPGGAWLWSTDGGDVFPSWSGPLCYPVKTPPNLPAVFTTAPVQVSGSHCGVLTQTLVGSDPDPIQCPSGTGVVYLKVSGPGSVDPVSGVWSYSPTMADVALGLQNVVVRVEDKCGAGSEATFQFSVTNNAPVAVCDVQKPVGKGNPISVDINVTDADACDLNFTFAIVSVTPVPVGPVSVDVNTGLLTFATDAADAVDGDGQVYDIAVEVSDGNKADTCTQKIEVLSTEPYQIDIEKTHGTFQGSHEYVDVSVTKGSEAIWGFDILISYDASALSFQTAVPGDIYAACGWEYFTYRYGASGNCGNGCPSGLLRVVGIAETNNGANHPNCNMTTLPFSLFTLDFLVTDNRTFECMYVPIRFFWMDCGDNAISYHEATDVANPYSQVLGISRFVWEGSFDPETAHEVSNGAASFPTPLGAPDICLEGDKEVPVRFVDFYNGGIDIVCADSIDARGDLNLNGTAYEIADAVLYSNYFVFGISVFDNYHGQVAASDVNADGIPLSVADLVYLIRVVVGDALPYPKVAPVAATVSYEGSTITVSESMGAAYVVVDGNVVPELLISGVDMKFAYDAAENVTRVLVVGMEKGSAIDGTFLNANGNIVSVELATYEGSPVSAKLVPTSFSLLQNYPNPFNPTTTISFTLPTASQYTITVYNVTGQVVSTINGQSDAGTVSETFDASTLSSGIYFYNVEAGSFSATKKMVLIK